jgi:HK97 family phage portal protein
VLIPIDNDEMTVSRDPRTRRAVYRWRSESLRLDYDVAHIKLVDVPGLLHGIGPIQSMSGNVGGALKADALAAEQFTEGAWVDGVLQAPTKLTKDEAERLRTQWDATHAGKRGTAVLEGGITYEPVQMTNADAEFLASRQWYAAEIARAYGIPLPLMGVSSGDSGGSLTYRNIEGVRAEYAQFAVQPVTDPIEAALSRLIPSTQEPLFRFGALLRADIATRYNVYEKALSSGILTVNEVRDMEGLPAIAGGDVRTPNASVQVTAEAPAATMRDDLAEVPE